MALLSISPNSLESRRKNACAHCRHQRFIHRSSFPLRFLHSHWFGCSSQTCAFDVHPHTSQPAIHVRSWTIYVAKESVASCVLNNLIRMTWPIRTRMYVDTAFVTDMMILFVVVFGQIQTKKNCGICSFLTFNLSESLLQTLYVSFLHNQSTLGI